MTTRAVSTVVDVAVCLLLVSAAVLTLVGVPDPSPDPTSGAAAETAAVLGSTTATVNYSLAPGARNADGDVAFPVVDGPSFRRTAHGSVAELLAAAVVANLTVEGQPVTHLGDDFAAAVRNATRPLLSGPGWRGQVVVTWSPYRGAHLGGELTVGPSPPPDVDVHAARLQVPSNLPTARERAAEVAPDGFDAVADVVARELVEGLFPPDRTGTRLLGSYPEARLTTHRYQSFADSYGVSVEEALADRNVARANRRLRAAVADAVASDVRKQFETPVEAAEAVRLRSVTITVRTWST